MDGQRYLDDLDQVFLFMGRMFALQCEEITISLVNCMASRINFIVRTSSAKVRLYLYLTCGYISECATDL